MDSFDHYATANIAEKWPGRLDSGAVQSIGAFGRNSTNGLRMVLNSFVVSEISRPFTTPGDTCIIGFAMKISALPIADIIFMRIQSPDSTVPILLKLLTSGAISVKTGNEATVHGTSGAIFTAGVSVYFEFKVLLHASAGTITMRANGTNVLALTGINTGWVGLTSWSNIIFGCLTGSPSFMGPSNWDFDDLYISNGIGSAPLNTFLGDVRVDARFPTAPGTTTGWTPSAGANWQTVDDTSPNGDTDYNSTSTLDVIDTFVVQDAPVVGATLYGIQHNLSMKKMDAGTASVAPVIRHSGTNNAATNINPGTTYAIALQVATEIAPGVAITESNFNAAEFGYKKTV